MYLDPALTSDPGCIETPQWVRARLLRESRTELVMLAIDFGVTVKVQSSHVHSLPPECRGVPPQVGVASHAARCERVRWFVRLLARLWYCWVMSLLLCMNSEALVS